MLFIVRGISGSGKSTLIRDLRRQLPNAAFIEQDALRINLLNRNTNAEEKLPDLINDLVKHLIKKGDVVLEGTLSLNVFENTLKNIIRRTEDHKLIYLHVSQSTAIQRINDIRHKTGKTLMTTEDFDRWYSKSQPSKMKDEIVIDTEKHTTEAVLRKILSK